MDRFAQKPYRARQDERTGKITIRFTHGGKRYHLSTGETDPRRAEKAADALHAQVTSGDHSPLRRVRGAADLSVLLAEWLADVETEVREPTAEEYTRYAFSLFEPFFRALPNLTTRACSDYTRSRLRRVQAKTVRKELSALRRFVAWLEEHGYLPEAPTIKPVPKAATGTAGFGGKRKQRRIDLTPEQVEAIIAALPQTYRGKPVRAWYRVMWETGLRRATLRRLSRPEHHQRGSSHLTITPDIDKSRYGRELPLSPRARLALDGTGPDVGLIFGQLDLRVSLQRAAEAAGLPPEDARHVSHHDLRHARLTHWGGTTTDLQAMAYAAGHRHVSTTALYVHAQRQAAERLVMSGHQVDTAKSKPRKARAVRSENPRRKRVRGAGLEPAR